MTSIQKIKIRFPGSKNATYASWQDAEIEVENDDQEVEIPGDLMIEHLCECYGLSPAIAVKLDDMLHRLSMISEEKVDGFLHSLERSYIADKLASAKNDVQLPVKEI